MRVLHVVPLLNLDLGGTSQVIPEIANGLARHGVEVEIATMGSENQPDDYLTGARHGNLSSLSTWLWNNVENYDLVHLHAVFSPSISIASRIARRKKIPFVITPHGMLEPWGLTHKAWKKRPYLRFVERATLNAAAGIHALTLNEVEQLRDLKITAPAFIVPNGIHIENFGKLPPTEIFTNLYPQLTGKKILLFMGRIDYKKGLDFLVSAFAKLHREGQANDWCLVVAGPDLVGYRSVIENLVRAENIEPHVVFTGMLAGEVKLAALNAAHLFALPSRSEGFSIAVLEAMAAKLPVVISEACNFPEVAQANAGVVIQSGVDGLSDALGGLFESHESLSSMGERGHQFVSENFTWAAATAKLKSVYADIVANRRIAHTLMTR